jgi:uncharacterized protein
METKHSNSALHAVAQERYETARGLLDANRSAEALQIYLELVEVGVRDPELFLQLGKMYHKGEGTNPNSAEAERWFTRAAELGSAMGQYNAAVALVNQGKYDQARTWLENAAAQGFTPAMYHLGRMHELGRWGPRDRPKAFAWFEQAATKGHIWAERQSAVMLMSGYAGLARVPEGVKRFVTLLPRAWWLRKMDPDSEYLKA